MQAMVSTPLAFNLSASATNPGTCLAEQVGVKAPGRAKATTFFPGGKISAVVIALGPSGPSMRNVALGILSPTLAILLLLDRFGWVPEAEAPRPPLDGSDRRPQASPCQ